MNYHILVVEDDPHIRLAVKMVLAYANHSVIETDRGSHVVELALAHEPDLILLDLMLPGIDGFEVLRRLRASPATANLPVIIVSALNQVEDRVKGLELGADDYLPKPFDSHELLARINAVVTRSRSAAHKRRGKVFGFMGVKGGVGTTTAVIEIGLALQANRARQTVVADMHLAFGTLVSQLNLRPVLRSTAELAAMLPAEIDEEAIATTLVSHESGLRVLGGPLSISNAYMFTADHLVAILKGCAHSASFVLVDLPTDPDILHGVAQELDGLVLVSSTDPIALHVAEKVSRYVHEIELEDRLSVLLNQWDVAELPDDAEKRMLGKLHCPLLGRIPYSPATPPRPSMPDKRIEAKSQPSKVEETYQQVGETLSTYADFLKQFRAEWAWKAPDVN